MIKVIPTIFVVLLFLASGTRNSPSRPRLPEATAQDSMVPTSIRMVDLPPPQTPNPSPTPFPTPVIDIAAYLPKRTEGRTVRVSGKDLASLIQAAEDDATAGTVIVEGGGSLTKQIVLKRHTIFEGSTYSCDWKGETDYGAIQIANGVLVEAKGTTFLEPTYQDSRGVPALEVFQALDDSCCSHEGAPHDVAITGDFTIQGRQTSYDGGVRSSILLGNCTHCAVVGAHLKGTASIGVTVGGNAAKGNFAKNVLIYRNSMDQVPAANIAVINAEDVIVAENKITRPSKGPPFGGGVSGVDLEPNTVLDHMARIQIFNNDIAYDDAIRFAAGTAMVLQNPYASPLVKDVVAVNNRVSGGSLTDQHERNERPLTMGVWVNGPIPGLIVANNWVSKSGQAGYRFDYGGAGYRIENNTCVSCGGGGLWAMMLYGISGATVKGNSLYDYPGTWYSTASAIRVCESAKGRGDAKNNIFRDNNVEERWTKLYGNPVAVSCY